MKSLILPVLALVLFSVQAQAKKTFVYCSEGSPSAFNPQITSDGTSNNAAAHTIYDRLVDFKYGSTEIIPSLAESWTLSEDRLTYTFKLKKGVKFHNTKYFSPSREFNADDVIFSIDRQRLTNHPYHTVNGGSYEYFRGMGMHDLIKDVKKVDNHTVQIILNRPEAPFLANMAMSFMSILSKEYADQLASKGSKDKLDHQPIGTGPYVFNRYKKDAVIRYSKNHDYFRGAPKIDRLVFAITPEPGVRYQKLKKGECHLIIEPPPSDLQAMKKTASIKLMEAPGLNVGYLAMNVQKKPFDNRLVRLAINHALNKEAYIKAIYLGHAMSAKNPMPPSLWSYNNKIEDYPYDLAKAKKLLKDAGYPNGFETELWTLPVTRPYNPGGKKMGEMMQADLAKIGIKVKLQTYDWPTYLKKSRNGEHEMIQLGWSGDNGDPDNFLHVLLGCQGVNGGSNVAKWCDKEFDRLVMEAKLKTQQSERMKLYKQAQRIFKKEAPWAPIAHSIVFRAMAKNVTGYKMDPLGGDIFKYVDLK